MRSAPTSRPSAWRLLRALAIRPVRAGACSSGSTGRGTAGRSAATVVFVPSRTASRRVVPVEVLTGFVNADGDAHGRPVGVAIGEQGALLVADDVGNTIWRVSAADRVARALRPFWRSRESTIRRRRVRGARIRRIALRSLGRFADPPTVRPARTCPGCGFARHSPHRPLRRNRHWYTPGVSRTACPFGITRASKRHLGKSPMAPGSDRSSTPGRSETVRDLACRGPPDRIDAAQRRVLYDPMPRHSPDGYITRRRARTPA